SGVRNTVEGHFTLHRRHVVSIQVAAYDRSKPLIIDPILSYASYLGGSGAEGSGPTVFTDTYIGAIAVDSAGSAYVTGSTGSTDFPTVSPYQPANGGGNSDAYVAKFTPDGSALVYSTYLGGSGGDSGTGIAVDASGNAYIAGSTFSNNFPTTTGSFRTSKVSQISAFVTKLNPSGSALVYSTYLDGAPLLSPNGSLCTGIAVDSFGDAYVTGEVSGLNFPTTSGALQPTNPKGPVNPFEDGFVTKFAADGASLIYSTYLAGSNNNDFGTGIAVDSTGAAYITGRASSTDFPTVNPVQATLGGGPDAFVTKLNSAGSALVYSTYLGGISNDQGNGIAVDSSGDAYVTGVTSSTDFPTVNPFQSALVAPPPSAFVAKFAATGSLVYSTYLGGGGAINNGQQGNAIATDSAGDAYVAGYTSSPSFPTFDPIQLCGGDFNDEAFVTEFNPDGSALIYSTCLGGSGGDIGMGIAVDAAGSAYVTGSTASTDFPVTQGAAQTTFGGATDAFVAKIAATTAPQAVLAPTSLAFPSQTVGTTSAAQMITLSNPGNATLTITGISLAGTNPSDFAQSDTCGGTLAAAASCTIFVTFTPASAANFNAIISVADNATGSPQTAALSGTGVATTAPQAVLAPTSLAFPNQTAGTTSAAQVITLSNPGNATLAISSIVIGGVNRGAFSNTTTCGSTLAASASCNISVTFAPTSAGSFAATVSLTDNATNSLQSAMLSGTGVAQVQADFSLSSLNGAQTVSAGGSAQYTIIVASMNGAFNNAVTLSASGLPAGATATFSPGSVTPGSGSANSTMTVQTAAAIAGLRSPGERPLGRMPWISLTSIAFVAGGVFVVGCRNPKLDRRRILMLTAVLGLMASGLSACGGGSPGTKTAQTYTITVTGTNGNVQNTSVVTLVVQ
ncbi:MAG: SBBP repeat-containing protein, partial [Candidatus Korobacteraceae bacterium]